ncbi:MAG: hypothetical protein WCK33_01335 [Phycisphaerae bacterium]
MGMCTRDIAKVLTGVALNEVVGHWWLGTIGTRFLPLDFGWFTFTREANWVAMGAWPLVAAACAWLAWRRVEPQASVRAVVAARAASATTGS